MIVVAVIAVAWAVASAAIGVVLGRIMRAADQQRPTWVPDTAAELIELTR